MRLTQIKLTGFKSFTDPTTIHVPGQLVAVIGPNGCGKSNVIDAVRWVLGEASAKQLRGESMQDVIFNGAATRRPAPRASVELVFDNSDHNLQGAWGQYAEVSIKRQLTRQGESSYFINNQPVRRRDITDLFLGTGVGARGYAVIEQGMISRIIEARPEELRAYIEEAAGVSKYKERRRETESRLKDTREHLQRLSDWQGELSRQVEKLEKQAVTAEKYRELQAELAHNQQLADYLQWQEALTEADLRTQQHEEAQMQAEAVQQQIHMMNEHLQTLRQSEHEQQQQQHALNQEYALLREQMARVEEQLRARQAQQQRMQRDRVQAQAQVQKIMQEQQQLDDEIAVLDEEVQVQQAELAEWAMTVAEREMQLPEEEQRWQQMQAAHQNQQEEYNRIQREHALKQQQYQQKQDALRQHEARLAQLREQLAQLPLPDQDAWQTVEQEAEILQQQYDESEAALGGLEEQVNSRQQQVQAAEQQYRAANQHYLTLQAQHDTLADLLRLHNAQDVWADTPFADTPVLWQNVQAPEEWQHALSVVLAQRLHARALPNNASTNPAVLPTQAAAWMDTSITVSQKMQPAQALIHQIRSSDTFQAALHYWLDGVLCAPDLAYALAHRSQLQGREIWLTPEGHCVDKVGAVLFDAHQSQQWIQQQSRLDALAEQLDLARPQAEQCDQEVQAAREAQQHLTQQYHTAQAQHRQYAQRLQALHHRLHEYLSQSNQRQLRVEQIERECARIEQDIRQWTAQCNGLADDIAALEESSTALQQQTAQGADAQQAQQQAVKQAQLALLEANRQYGMVELAHHKQQQRLTHLQQQRAECTEQLSEWQERQTELALLDENDVGLDELQREQWETWNDNAGSLQEQLAVGQQHLAEIQAQGQEGYAQQQALSARLPELQAAAQQLLLQQQEALLNARRFHDNLQAASADEATLAQEARQRNDLDVLQQAIRQTQQAVSSLGAVNLAALQELEQAKERDDYYRRQSEDVQAAIDLLEEAIVQIDHETKTRFQTTFDAVNDKVKTFFPTLFGGGEAGLHLTDNDLLSAGVSIMAQPPGKRNSSIHLLSGGEKALTAMSLVFALFSLNPAPFCLLDEVDAPLDDANTSRFCKLVKQMSAQTQFLYISHNRLTMEMAEQLIGVTMQEKGVSRIVAVDIQQALQMAEQVQAA